MDTTVAGIIAACGAVGLVVGWLVDRLAFRSRRDGRGSHGVLSALACSLAYAGVVARYGLSAEGVELLALCAVLLSASLADLDAGVIPNASILAALGVRVAYLLAASPNATLGAVGLALASGAAVAAPVLLLAGVMDRVLGRPSLGGGDVKLFFVAGVYFGWEGGLLVALVSSVVGVGFGLAWAKSGRCRQAEGMSFPFGPAIALGCWVAALLADGVATALMLG